MVGSVGPTRRLGHRRRLSFPMCSMESGCCVKQGRTCVSVRLAGGVQGWWSPLPPAPSLTQTLNLREGAVPLGPL